MLVKDYLQRCGQGKGINKECWDAEGRTVGGSCCYPEPGGKGLGRAWPMPSESSGLEGPLWDPSIGSSNCGGAAKIHRRCSFQTCGSSDKEILWPLSLPSTFWLPAAGRPPLPAPHWCHKLEASRQGSPEEAVPKRLTSQSYNRAERVEAGKGSLIITGTS